MRFPWRTALILGVAGNVLDEASSIATEPYGNTLGLLALGRIATNSYRSDVSP
jgi:hypothetical protein